jgi:ABC-type transport system involved in cytochrome c biogenesis permease subunit
VGLRRSRVVDREGEGVTPTTTWSGVLAGLCAAASLLGFSSWAVPRSRVLVRAADVAGLACLGGAVAVWIARWRIAGHVPLFGTYESAQSLAVAVLGAALLARLAMRDESAPWPLACGTAALLLGHGLRFDPTAYALTISERSWVVDVHAVLAWSAFAALTLNVAMALLCLRARGAVSHRRERRLAFTLSLGFVLHSAMMASGSLYKFLLFGKLWSFDPVETLGFVAWVGYGTLLHMHLFARWSGKRLARWCLGLFVLLIVSYRGIVYFPSWSTYHIFDMDLRMHLTGTETIPAGEP